MAASVARVGSCTRTAGEVTTSVKNTFLHFDCGLDQSPGAQPCLGRARTMPTPNSHACAELPAGVEGSRFCMSDQDESSDADSCGPQPNICRDTTYDEFDEDGQPSLCRDTTYDDFDEEGQPSLCRDTTYDAFEREATPTQLPGKVPPQLPGAWQAAAAGTQPAPAPGASHVVMPNLLPTLLAGPHTVQSAGQPTLMFVGVPPTAQPVPEPMKPAAKSAAASRGSPVARGRGGTRRQAPKASSAPPPPPGACELSGDADALRLHWTVDARKLRKNERVIVSPIFDLPAGDGRMVPFRLMLFPSKGAGSFRGSSGLGTMLLKCEATAQESPDCCLELHFIVGRQPPRGPLRHDFVKSGVCSLPEEQQEWNFARAIDQASQTVAVCLEIVRL